MYFANPSILTLRNNTFVGKYNEIYFEICFILVSFNTLNFVQGENAQYEVFLESVYPEGAEEAFMISPTRGYQEQSFIVSTRNHHLLDYEVEKYQNIQLKVRGLRNRNLKLFI